MRIVAGSHRGRRLEAPADQRIRPTSDRIRESLFNILDHKLGGFAGTGALGLEALSRGAATALFIDKDRDALALARRNAASLDLTAKVDFRLADITRPPQLKQQFDLVLLDPPYGQELAAMALGALAAAGWLAPDAVAVIEADRAQPETLPDGFTAIDIRDYGRTRIVLARGISAG